MAALTHPLAGLLGHSASTLQLALLATAALIAILLGVWLVRRGTKALRSWNASAGVKAAALVALMATGVSMDTNWMFWGTHLHVTNPVVRAFLFADLEEALMVFAIQARENTLREDGNGKQGIQGVLVWVMSGLAMLPAWIEAGWMEGTVRALAGPGLAALLWHFALGLEFKVVRPKVVRDRALAKIARNLRERIMARLGITGPDQSALEIRQDRALVEVVRLTMLLEAFGDARVLVKTRRKRLVRHQANAMRLSGAADDPQRLQMIVNQIRIIRHAAALTDLEIPSPWEAYVAALADSDTDIPRKSVGRKNKTVTDSADTGRKAAADSDTRKPATSDTETVDTKAKNDSDADAGQSDTDRRPTPDSDTSNHPERSMPWWAEKAAPLYRQWMREHNGTAPKAPMLADLLSKAGYDVPAGEVQRRKIRAATETHITENPESEPEPDRVEVAA